MKSILRNTKHPQYLVLFNKIYSFPAIKCFPCTHPEHEAGQTVNVSRHRCDATGFRTSFSDARSIPL